MSTSRRPVGWLNLVERRFAELTERRVRRGSHTDRSMLGEGDAQLLGSAQQRSQALVWTADADLFLGKVARLSKRISDSGHQRHRSLNYLFTIDAHIPKLDVQTGHVESRVGGLDLGNFGQCATAAMGDTALPATRIL